MNLPEFASKSLTSIIFFSNCSFRNIFENNFRDSSRNCLVYFSKPFLVVLSAHYCFFFQFYGTEEIVTKSLSYDAHNILIVGRHLFVKIWHCKTMLDL